MENASLSNPGGWEQLALGADALPTQDAAWTIASLASFPGQPHFIEHHDGEELVGIVPLVRRGGTLELAGARELGEPADLLAASAGELDRLAERLARGGLPVALERVPAGSPSLEALRRAGSGRATINVHEVAGNPWIELDDERWREPGGGLSSSRRSQLRRSRRRADPYGEIGVELLTPGPAEIDALLDEAFAIEARSWKGRQRTSVSAVPPMDAFFRRYAKELAQRGILHLDFLRFGERRVAMQFGARWRARHWLFKIGYDESYAQASPGQILLAESVADAARCGCSKYELLGSQSSWTDVWTKDVQPCVRVVVLPWRPGSAILVGSIAGRAATKRLRRIGNEGVHAIAERARSRYVAGEELAPALAEERHYAERGFATTVGYWNPPGASRETVATEATESARGLPAGSEVSIKLAAMGGDGAQLEQLLELCLERDLTLHVDALGADSASEAQAAARRLARLHPGKVGCTLPGRWARSPGDAGRLRDEPLRIRVVKGEFPDQESAELDPGKGFLEVAELLTGHECHVEVATQDAALAEAALEALLAKQTSCELQVLHGMNSRRAVGVARRLDVPVRVYLPYGNSRLPYRRSQLARDPRRLAGVARDLLPLGPRRPPGG